MPLATAFAIFFLIWWVVLFAVLPWGIKSQHEREGIAPAPIPVLLPKPGSDGNYFGPRSWRSRSMRHAILSTRSIGSLLMA
jgi:hypothetical protein